MIRTPNFPRIETTRLLLTPLLDSDAARVFSLFSDNRIIEFYDLEVFTKADQARSWIQKHRERFEKGVGIRWAIRCKETNTLLGTCGFNSLEGRQHSGEIGYEISPEYWGDGIASEAVRAIVKWAFTTGLELPLHRIVARTMLDNEASARLLNKLGFKEEGIERAGGHWKGAFHDLRSFVLLSDNS